MTYLIIGAGVAGVNAAEEIRRRDPEGEIVLLDGEGHALYSRVLLPHYVKGKIPREKVFLKKEDWYAQQRIDWQRGVFAEEIDTKNKFVRTSEGRELPYDVLLITTGGEVRLLEEDKSGVCYFRTLDDADQLIGCLQKGAAGGKEKEAMVYGSGFISFEFINIFSHFGYQTTVVMRGSGFFNHTLSPASQGLLLRHVEKQGVVVKTGTEIVSLEGEKELTGVRLESGESVSCSLLGVGIGISPDRGLFEGAGLSLGRGILANESLETDLPGVYTAGDVAEAMDRTAGRHILAGNWMSALMQGRAVGKTMSGERTAVDLVSSYATNLLGKEVVMIGDVDREKAEEISAEEGEENALELFVREGRTVGAILIGDVKERQAITKAIKDRMLYAR